MIPLGPSSHAIAARSPSDVLLAIVPVRIRSGGRMIETYALLDSGSQATLMRMDAARALGLKGKKKTIKFGTFHGHSKTQPSQRSSLTLSLYQRSAIASSQFQVPTLYPG